MDCEVDCGEDCGDDCEDDGNDEGNSAFTHSAVDVGDAMDFLYTACLRRRLSREMNCLSMSQRTACDRVVSGSLLRFHCWISEAIRLSSIDAI